MVTRSDRLDHVHSDIRGPLYQEALRMESEGINVLKLNTGNPGRFGFKLPNSVRQALEIVNAVNRDSVGLTVDCINIYLHDKYADVDFIRKIPKEKLFVLHINDCEDLPLGILDHCHRLMPGLGAIPVQEVAAAVQAVGYDGPACLELFRPEYWRMPAEDVIRMGAETTRPFLG